MRWLVVVVVGLSAAVQAAPKPSNPAFLGIGMHDSSYGSAPLGGGAPHLGPCVIDTVTPGAGAQAAGIQPGDTILRLDGAPIENCDALVSSVTTHEQSDVIKIDVVRDGRPRSLSARLTSRGELFHTRYAGKSLVGVDAIRLDDGRGVDLAEIKRGATIVGWFSPRCTSCKALLARVADWTAAHKELATAFAITTGNGEDLASSTTRNRISSSFALDLPLALVEEGAAQRDELLFGDTDRASLMVIDCRGIVTYVAPIAADGSDTDAALDELYAAAAQARSPRR